jgi:hypothetical protein
VWGWTWRVIVVTLALLAGPSCGPLTESGRSASYMIIDDLRGASGAEPTKLANALSSDVMTCSGEGESRSCGIFQDPGEVVIRLGLKDPGTPQAPNTPTIINYITVTHYKVVYTRTDGRSTPGVDVPYPIEGGTTFTSLGGIVSGTFVLVRAQAKMEAPLLALVGSGGAISIATTAEVTFYGHDQTGIPVSATGYISVTFSDWADPQGT